MDDQPLMTFKSHIQGMNADVSIFPDRVEWVQSQRMGTGSKAALGVMTMGISLAKTGLRKHQSSEIIPVRSISSVVVERDGFHQKVRVICSGNEVDFRCSREEAESAKALLTNLMLGRHPALQAAPASSNAEMLPPPAEPLPASEDIAAKLAKLADMRSSGVLTDDEFAAAKARLLN